MELEGVLGLVDMLREVVGPMRMFLGLYGTSQKSQTKKIFLPKYCAEVYELFDIPLEFLTVLPPPYRFTPLVFPYF